MNLNILHLYFLQGYDYQSNPTVVDLISSFTNYMVQVTPPKIELTLTDGENSYKNYFWPHYIVRYYYSLSVNLYFSLFIYVFYIIIVIFIFSYLE